MPRHRKLTQKLVGFPMFHKGTNKYTFSLTHPLTRAFTNVSGGVDPDLAAFITATGATNTESLGNLVTYLKQQSLWASSRIYPMKAAQNAGSGSIAYGLGGLTSNNMTLVSSPTWGADGIAFNGTSQYGTIPDFLGSQTITGFARVAETSATPTLSEAILGQYDSFNNQRSFILSHAGNIANAPYRVNRSSDGTTNNANFEVYDGPGNNGSTADRTLVAQWVAGGGRSIWINKSQQSLSLVSGTSQTSRFDANVPVTFAAILSNNTGSNFANLKGKAFAMCNTTLTDTQREAITDLINAL